MPFSGTAVISQTANGIVRITGLVLDVGASGVITESGGGGQVELPASFQPGDYRTTQGPDAVIDPIEAVEITVNPLTAVAYVPVQIVKTLPGDPPVFTATFTNNGGVGTGSMEMYFKFHT